MTFLFAFSFLFCTIDAATAVETSTTCQIALTTIEEGSKTYATCALNHNLRDVKSYTLYVSHNSTNTRDPDQVLICHHHQGTLCSVAEGYKLQYLNGTNLQIGILTSLAELNTRFNLHVLSTVTPSQSQGKATTCTAPTVTKGTEAYVLCNFTKNVSHLKTYTVTVEHYPAGEGLPVAVLMCIQLQRLQCFTSKGYSFDYEINHQLRLRIPSASDQNAGRYACDILSPEIKVADATEFCTLHIGDISDADSSICEKKVLQVGLGVAAGALSFGFVTGCIVGRCCFRKRCKKQNMDGVHTPKERGGKEPNSPTEQPLVESPIDSASNKFTIGM